VNAKRLAGVAPAEKFTFARNTINFERVLHQAYGAPTQHAVQTANDTTRPDNQPDPDGLTPVSADELTNSFDPLDLPEAVTQLMAYHGIDDVRDEVERRSTVAQLLPPAPGVKTFITVGRLSPEKNHGRLLRAFDLVHQEDPMTRLVILGDGPLRDQLSRQIENLGLTAAVSLPGHLPNPCVIVANADCFVLSSDYEGQPMVLLEALILGRPIVTTSFGSVKGALPPGYGRVVERSVEALAGGMRDFLRGKVRGRPFDYAEYNRAATREFYAAIGAG
jgi:CDP-glycerol glycerophosphotransferase